MEGSLGQLSIGAYSRQIGPWAVHQERCRHTYQLDAFNDLRAV